MKNIFRIYKNDIKKIISSYAAIIVILALCILPSLYAWFNILASWDPYSESATSGIKIGVVNNDEGTILFDNEINIGNQVVDELKENKSLGWQFVTEEEAKESIEMGKYYANIIIPKNFTKDLTSIVTSEVKKGEIIYQVNEKINAIAPKLTGKGATAIQEKVTKSIIETVSKVVFGVTNDVGVELEGEIPKISTIKNALLDLQTKFKSMNETVDLTYDGAKQLKDIIQEIEQDIPLIQETIVNASGLSSSIEEFLGVSKDGVNNIAPIIKNDIITVNSLSKEIVQYTQGVIEAINSGSEKVPEMVDSLINKVNSANSTVESLIKILEKINKISPGKPLTGIIDNLQQASNSLDNALVALNKIKDSVGNGIDPDLTFLENIISIANDVSRITDNIYSNFDSVTIPKINEIFDEAYRVAENTIAILKAAEEKLPQIENILGIAFKGVDKGIEGLDYVREVLPKAEEMINEITEKVVKIEESNNLQEIIDLLKVDVTERTNFLSEPVELNESKIFPIANYGTAMTPFYSVLSLWVGVLLITSILTVEASGEYKSYEVYFGKLLLFLTVTGIQGLIVALGDLYLLKIGCDNNILFILGNVFSSIVFTIIVYSLVSVLGNVGKVGGIILLVLQVAGSGGTFPIQLTPKFFQVINPFLPFTYSISIEREAIGGVVNSVLFKDISILCIYSAIFIVISIILKKPINKLLKGFIDNFNKSGIGEH